MGQERENCIFCENMDFASTYWKLSVVEIFKEDETQGAEGSTKKADQTQRLCFHTKDLKTLDLSVQNVRSVADVHIHEHKHFSLKNENHFKPI